MNTTFEATFTYENTKAFTKYQEDKKTSEWMKDNCSVFDVTATVNRTEKKEFSLNGYEILQVLNDWDVDFATVDPDELFEKIKDTGLLEKYL